MKLRSSYMLALVFLMLTAFGGRANAQCSPDQGFGPASGRNQYFTTAPVSIALDVVIWCSRDYETNPNYTYLAFQTDGNLVLYDDGGNKVLWASNTNYSYDGGPYLNGGNSFVLQADTNAVIYDVNWNPLWASGTNQYNNAYLEVLDGYWGIWFTDAWRNVRRYP